MRRCPVKKWLVLSVLCVVLAVAWGGYVPVQAQTGDLKPTFLDPTPGLYISGWPAFSVSYPKDWAVQPFPPGPRPDFRVGASRPNLPPSPVLSISVFMNFRPLSDMAKWFIGLIFQAGKDFNILYDKPSKLSDGTPAQEAEIEWVVTNGPKMNTFLLGTDRNGTWTLISLEQDNGKTGEDLKSIAYSMKFQPEREKPVDLPPGVRALFERWSDAIVRGDVTAVMDNYSNHFNHNGATKAMIAQWMATSPDSPVKAGLASLPMTATFFEAQGDKAYVSGFYGGKLKDGTPARTTPVGNLMQLIKENGEWKYLGNNKQ
jgi:hypothetical protein